MVPTPWTPSFRRAALLLAATTLVLLASLSLSQHSSAASIAKLAERLAADTQQYADLKVELSETAAQLRSTRTEHRRLRREVEGRLVAIYKHGSSSPALTRVAGGQSMRDVSTSLVVLGQVADNDERLLRRWQKLDRRLTKLIDTRTRLADELDAARDRVREARQALSEAERAAEAAREQAARMSTIPDSPLLPKVGHPENEAADAADSGEPMSAVPQPIGFQQVGVASMYHDSFTGEKTANGERYDPNAFTAAHPSLPFGTWVNVAGPGGTISVRINDRGPFVGGRVIDLSRAAANAISLPGIATVQLSVAA